MKRINKLLFALYQCLLLKKNITFVCKTEEQAKDLMKNLKRKIQND
jgi:hypothetical protein